MKIDTLLNSMLRDLWVDLQSPAVLWQLGTLAICLALAWVLDQRVLRWWQSTRAQRLPPGGSPGGAQATGGIGAAPQAASTAIQAVGRVLFPLFALGLVVTARPVLGIWHKTNLLRLAIALLVAFALVRVIVFAVSKLARTPALAAFERLLVALVWIVVALHVTGYVGEVVDFLESVVFPMGKQRVSLWTILSGAFWVMLTLLVALWIGGVLEARLLALESGDAGVRAVLARVVRAVLLLLAVLIGLSLVGLDITALSVFGGALGVGLGLGLQRIASSYISGFVVLLERRVRIGDLVSVDKYTGFVTEIRSRFTIVKSGEGWEAIVPNELLMVNPVQNFSLAPHVRMKTSLTLGYDTDLDRVLPLLAETAATIPAVLAEPAPAAMLTSFGADGFTVDVAYSIGGPDRGRGAAQSEVNRAIWRLIRREQVTLPYPQRDIRVQTLPPPG